MHILTQNHYNQIDSQISKLDCKHKFIGRDITIEGSLSPIYSSETEISEIINQMKIIKDALLTQDKNTVSVFSQQDNTLMAHNNLFAPLNISMRKKEDSNDYLISFYDARYLHEEKGQFITEYSLSTFTESSPYSEPRLKGQGLDLNGQIKDWKVDGKTMDLIMNWAMSISNSINNTSGSKHSVKFNDNINPDSIIVILSSSNEINNSTPLSLRILSMDDYMKSQDEYLKDIYTACTLQEYIDDLEMFEKDTPWVLDLINSVNDEYKSPSEFDINGDVYLSQVNQLSL